MENETACSLANCREAMMVLPKAPANVGLLWDPMNGTTTEEKPYPDGYDLLDKSRLFHVELKDVEIDPATGERHTVAVGDGVIPYAQIFKALASDGYKGVISMETHFSIDGSREKASRRSMQGIFKALEEQGHGFEPTGFAILAAVRWIWLSGCRKRSSAVHWRPRSRPWRNGSL